MENRDKNNNENKVVRFPNDNDRGNESVDTGLDKVKGKILYDIYNFIRGLPKAIIGLVIIGIVLFFLIGLGVYLFITKDSDNSQAQNVIIENNIVEASREIVFDDQESELDELENEEISDIEKTMIISNDDTISSITNPEIDDTDYSVDNLPGEMVFSDWNGYADLELSKTSVLDRISYGEIVDECITGFNSAIMQREEDVKLDQRMTRAYAESIMSANEIYQEYEAKLDYYDKVRICEDAANKRNTAKQIYRQESNEQIIANYYAKCAKNAKSEDTVQRCLGFYQMALDYYFDAYAVSCKFDTGKIKALDYIATCYFNIGACRELRTDLRKEAYLYAISIFELYLEKGAESNELVTLFNIGRAYMRLVELENAEMEKDEERMYYYICNAYSHYTTMLNNPNCRSRIRPNVYGELGYLTQYLQDNIDEIFYSGTVTKKDLQIAHQKYAEGNDYYLDLNP